MCDLVQFFNVWFHRFHVRTVEFSLRRFFFNFEIYFLEFFHLLHTITFFVVFLMAIRIQKGIFIIYGTITTIIFFIMSENNFIWIFCFRNTISNSFQNLMDSSINCFKMYIQKYWWYLWKTFHEIFLNFFITPKNINLFFFVKLKITVWTCTII